MEGAPNNPQEDIQLGGDELPRSDAMHNLNTLVISYVDSRFIHLNHFMHAPSINDPYYAYFDQPYTTEQLAKAGVPVVQGLRPGAETIDLYVEHQRRRMEVELGKFAIEGFET